MSVPLLKQRGLGFSFSISQCHWIHSLASLFLYLAFHLFFPEKYLSSFPRLTFVHVLWISFSTFFFFPLHCFLSRVFIFEAESWTHCYLLSAEIIGMPVLCTAADEPRALYMLRRHSSNRAGSSNFSIISGVQSLLFPVLPTVSFEVLHIFPFFFFLGKVALSEYQNHNRT